MPRPTADVLCSHIHPKTYMSTEVLKADAIYAIFYDGSPINLRSLNILIDGQGRKYRRVSFSNSGYAFNVAKKLNELFKTDQFEVHKLRAGTKITQE